MHYRRNRNAKLSSKLASPQPQSLRCSVYRLPPTVYYPRQSAQRFDHDRQLRLFALPRDHDEIDPQRQTRTAEPKGLAQ